MNYKKNVLITLPVYNEEKQLYKRTIAVYRFIKKYLTKFNTTILIADNASNDKTPDIGKSLANQFDNVEYFFTPIKGRGKVLYKVWKNYNFDCYVYMDIDLSTDINYLPRLIKSILEDKSDIAIGTRNAKRSKVQRTLKRTIISKVYITLLKTIFNLKVTDTQCGFKALSRHVKNKLWPKMNPKNWKGSAWFFDTELLILSEKVGLKICEIPIKWKGSSYTTTSLFNDIKENIKGITRMLKTKPWKK